MFKLRISRIVKNQLKLISKVKQPAFSEVFKEITEDPLIGKPLIKEFVGVLSYKVGVYRILYRINNKDKTVTIISAGHRSVVYS